MCLPRLGTKRQRGPSSVAPRALCRRLKWILSNVWRATALAQLQERPLFSLVPREALQTRLHNRLVKMDARNISVITAKLPNYRLLCSLAQLTEEEFRCSDENCIIYWQLSIYFHFRDHLTFSHIMPSPHCAAPLL